MSDNKDRVDAITDEAIASFVALVECAELLARGLDCSVAKAVEIQFRTLQSFQRMQQKAQAHGLALFTSMPVKGRPQ